MKVRVPIYGRPNAYATIETEAVFGASLGDNLFYRGVLLRPEDVLNTFARGSTTVVSAGGSSGGSRPPPYSGPRTTDELDEGRFNKYFSVERAQDAIGSALTNSANVTFTYDDGANTISADLTATGVAADTYGDATHVPQITVDAKGRVTAVTDVEIEGAGGIESIVAGDGIVVDATDPANPIVSAELTDAPSDGTTYGRKDGGWVAATGGGVDPANGWEEYDELNGDTGSPFTAYRSGGVGAVTFGGEAGHPGTVTIQSENGTTANSGGILKSPSPSTATPRIFLSSGVDTFAESLIKIPTLFSGAAGQIRFGLMDEISGAPGNGVHMQYDSSTTKWRLYSRWNSTDSESAESTSDVTTGWHLLRIEVYGNTSAKLFVDGTEVCELIPTVQSTFVNQGMSYGAQVQKTGGTGVISIVCDYMRAGQTFTTPRF